jgi:hypothetical protein
LTCALDGHGTTELPEINGLRYSSLVLGTSEDGRRLSLIASLPCHQVEVWEHIADGRWMLRRRIDVGNLLPNCPKEGLVRIGLISGFCPRSGCVLGEVDGQYLIIGVDGGSPRSTQRIPTGGHICLYTYEMDWSTYISKMKYF